MSICLASTSPSKHIINNSTMLSSLEDWIDIVMVFHKCFHTYFTWNIIEFVIDCSLSTCRGLMFHPYWNVLNVSMIRLTFASLRHNSSILIGKSKNHVSPADTPNFFTFDTAYHQPYGTVMMFVKRTLGNWLLFYFKLLVESLLEELER